MELLRSVFLYLFVFSFSLLLFWLSENKTVVFGQLGLKSCVARKNLSVNSGLSLAIIAMVFVSLFAGLRATSVGADTRGYPIIYTDIAKLYSDFPSFLNDPVGIGDEPLGAFVVWVCSRFNCGIVPLLFCYQFMTICPVYFGVRKHRQYLSVPLAMAIYLFFFFNNSLNMMRQSVSCAFLFYAFACYFSSLTVSMRMLLSIFAALAFHRSAVYGLMLIVLALFIMQIDKKWLRIGCFCLLAISPLAMMQISQWLIGSGLADSHMKYYLDVFVTGNVDQDWNINPFGSYSLSYLFIYTALVYLPFIYNSSIFKGWRSLREDPHSDLVKKLDSLRLLNVTGHLIYVVLLFSLFTMYGIRFSIYLDFFLMLTIPYSCEGSNALQKKLFLFMALVVFWFIWIIRLGWSASTIFLFFFE